MARVGLGRRAFVEALAAVPFGGVALSAQTPGPPVLKVAAGSPVVRHRQRWTATEAVSDPRLLMARY